MISKLLLATSIILMYASSAFAQQVTAEVRTWNGQSFTMSEPSFEIFYTIVPSITAALGGGGYAPAGGAAAGGVVPGAPGAVAVPPPALGQGTTNIGVGSVGFQSGTSMLAASGTLLPEGPPSKQGRRPQENLTLSREGVQTHVPVVNLSSVTFTRSIIGRSGLPPYASSKHFRHGAIAVLADGSRVEGDYVNLGTAILRGTTPQGTIDIPWDEIEQIRFVR